MMHSKKEPLTSVKEVLELSRQRMLFPFLTVILVCIALLLTGIFGRDIFSLHRRELPFLASVGEKAFFDDCGRGCAVADTASASLYTASGICIACASVSLPTPVCFAGKRTAIYFSPGESTLYTISSRGNTLSTPMDYPIRYAQINDNDVIAVILDAPDSKGLVLVYDRDMTPLFRWEAESGYPITVRVSDDDRLCINCATDFGSSLHIFQLDDESELGVYHLVDEIALDFGFLSTGSIAVLSEAKLSLLSSTGTLIDDFPFVSSYPTAWSLSGESAVISCSNGMLTVIDGNARCLARLETAESAVSLSVSEDHILVLFPSEATLYTSELTEVVSYQGVGDAQKVFLRSDLTALFAGGSSIRQVDFSQ